MVHYIYMIYCKKYSKYGYFVRDYYYTGETWNVAKRFKEHKNGIKSNWMSRNNITPIKIVRVEEVKNRSIALCRESQIKKLSRKKKEELVKGYSER